LATKGQNKQMFYNEDIVVNLVRLNFDI
jgi:hypothetical protein